jgi:Tfp pilus assembly protein PilE
MKNRGISLIVLVITIIVIIILAGSVILSLSNNNPIEQAQKAIFSSDVESFQSELLLYQTTKYVGNNGTYVTSTLQADDSNLSDSGLVVVGGKISQIITKLASGKYNGEFKIVNGSLVYTGSDLNKKSWAVESGIKLDTSVGNLFTGSSPSSSGGSILDVTSTLPGPVLGSKTWEMTKTGLSSQWNGWEGTYAGLFTGSIGDKWVVSGCYKTVAQAGLNSFWIGGFYTTDWSRLYNTSIVSSNNKIIADGKWHYFYCVTQLNESITNAMIWDGPSWQYSAQAGVLYMNGIEWRKIPAGT